MDLVPYVDDLRSKVMATAETGGAEALAQRLVSSSVTSAIQLAMLEVLSAATDEITREMVPGSVEVRLRGRNPVFVVSVPEGQRDDGADEVPAVAGAELVSPVPPGKEGAVSRINFRPPVHLKQRIEAAAADAGLSVNAWLIHASTAVLDSDHPARSGSRSNGRSGRFMGWVG